MQNKAPGGLKKRILFIDNDEGVRRVSDKMLKRLGFEVILARDVDEAIYLYRQALNEGLNFDAVILNLTSTSKKSGLNAIETLVEMDPEIKAIAISSGNRDPVLQDFQRYGFRGVLKKPYSLGELTRVTEEVVAQQQ